MRKQTTKYTAETIKARPIDMERLNKDLDNWVHEQHPDQPANVRNKTIGKHALVYEPKRSIIDEEFIGSELGAKITFYVYEETHEEGKLKSFGIFPTREATFTLDEVEKYLLPEVTLAEFTKERRGYNSRIQSNEYSWMKHFNS